MERDTDLVQWLESVKVLVRYADVIGDGLDLMPVDVFQQMRQLAIYELFYSISRKEQAEGLGVGPKSVSRMLSDEKYLEIMELVRSRAIQVAKSGGMMDTAEQLEPHMAEKVLHMALHGRGRDRLKALDEFTGRLSAKKGREDQLVIRMPPDLEAAILSAMETAHLAEQKLLPGGNPDIIDASVVPMASEDG